MKQVLVCPLCAKTPARITSTQSPNGGELYVGEDNEVYDIVDDNREYTCLDCDTSFYIGE